MARCFVAVALLAISWLVSGASNSYAAPCLIVTLTGTQGGPQSFNGARERWCALAMMPMNVGR
jgi:ribonuclease Z